MDISIGRGRRKKVVPFSVKGIFVVAFRSRPQEKKNTIFDHSEQRFYSGKKM